MPEISVIIPVYNASSTIRKCIDSVLCQTFQNFELLLINDGSTDNSGDICEEYARNDCRINVFHQNNKGVSATREFGKNRAKGKYSIYVDSDDWIESGMLEALYSKAIFTDADIVICDFYIDDNGTMTHVKQQISKMEGNYVICDILSGKVIGSMCNKLVRHSLYQKYDIHYPAGINYCEDAYVVIRLLLLVNVIEYIPIAYYHYVMRPQSLTHNVSKETFIQRKKYIYSIRDILVEPFFKTAVALNFVYIRKDAYYSNLFTPKELKRMLPHDRLAVFKFPCKLRVRICLYLASLGLCVLARLFERERDHY